MERGNFVRAEQMVLLYAYAKNLIRCWRVISLSFVSFHHMLVVDQGRFVYYIKYISFQLYLRGVIPHISFSLRLYVLIMSRTRFRVNPHYIVA